MNTGMIDFNHEARQEKLERLSLEKWKDVSVSEEGI